MADEPEEIPISEDEAGEYGIYDPLIIISTVSTAIYDISSCENLDSVVREKMFEDFQRTIWFCNKCIQKALQAELDSYKKPKKDQSNA